MQFKEHLNSKNILFFVLVIVCIAFVVQIASMSVAGIITSLWLMVLNVKYVVFFGLLAGVTDIIPIAGLTFALCAGVVAAFFVTFFDEIYVKQINKEKDD